MSEFYPFVTSDGSVGLYSKEYNDIYHSAAGALTEAYEKFIAPVNIEKFLLKKSIKVLDICYGIGYNTKSFLNFILKNYYFKNFEKNICHAKTNIETTYTYNSKHSQIKEDVPVHEYSEEYFRNNNAAIYTDNILPNIYIKAVDNNKFLAFLSAFIKTGVKNKENDNLNFKYKNIEKFLQSDKIIPAQKIDESINFLIFEKIVQNHPDIFENDEILQILSSKYYAKYFDPKIKGIFESFKNNQGSANPLCLKPSFLHNIYYKYVSKRYKNRLNSLKTADIDFELKIDDARNTIQNDKNLYDLIFLDAFTPSKCPSLWSFEFFNELYQHLEPDGMLLTYSMSAAVRSAMLESGFFIGNIYNERECKYTGTTAVKNPDLIKYPLCEYDLGLLKTTAGIFYRDENLTENNEAIMARRKSELKNSGRMPSSRYKKFKHDYFHHL